MEVFWKGTSAGVCTAKVWVKSAAMGLATNTRQLAQDSQTFTGSWAIKAKHNEYLYFLMPWMQLAVCANLAVGLNQMQASGKVHQAVYHRRTLHMKTFCKFNT